MKTYVDTSFLVRLYLTQSDSQKALIFMRGFRESLPFTPLHRHELRNALRLAVFRKEINVARCQAALGDMEADLADGILEHVPIAWTDAFREAEQFGIQYTESMGIRAMDLLHVGIAQTLGAKEFVTFDSRQAALAKVAGFKVRF